MVVCPIMYIVLLSPCSSLEEQFVTDENMVPALEASEEDLKVAHTKSYLSSLKVHTHTHDSTRLLNNMTPCNYKVHTLYMFHGSSIT